MSSAAITAPREDDGAVLVSSYGGLDRQVLRGRNVRLLDAHEDRLLDRLDPLDEHRKAELGHKDQHLLRNGHPLSGARSGPRTLRSSPAPASNRRCPRTRSMSGITT